MTHTPHCAVPARSIDDRGGVDGGVSGDARRGLVLFSTEASRDLPHVNMRSSSWRIGRRQVSPPDSIISFSPALRGGEDAGRSFGQSKFLVVSLVGERRLQARRRCTRPPHQLPKRPPCSCKLCGHGDQGFGPSQGFQTGTKFTCATQEGEVRASLREVECTVNGQGLSGKNGSTWVWCAGQ